MKKTGKVVSITLAIISLALVIYLIIQFTGTPNVTVGALSGTVKYAIPHNGAYTCTSVGTGQQNQYVNTGYWIDKTSIGVYTDQVTSIQIYISPTFWDAYFRSLLGGGVRAMTKWCDATHNNCQTNYQNLYNPGSMALALPSGTSLNPLKNSLYVEIQSRPTILSSWSANSNLGSKTQVSYAFTKYGLKYVSTTGNPAGSLFNGCESSCDLTCPTQKSRSDTGLIYTTENSLLPTESVPVLEYWEDLDIDLNNQMGATVYEIAKNEFCFGGAKYSASTVQLDNGVTYIYPNTATRQNVQCCNGATTSTLTEDKTCVNNVWQTVTKDTRIKCSSDFSCPGQGQNNCQNRLLSGWHCSGYDSTIGRFCVKDDSTRVACCSQADCPSDQTCQANKCVGGGSVAPITPKCSKDTDCVSGQICLNGVCSTNQTIKCAWNQEYVVTEDYGLLGWRHIMNNPLTVRQCKTASWFYLMLLGAFIILALIIYIIIKMVKR